MKNKIIIDLDNTITIDDKTKDYWEKPVNIRILEALNNARINYDIEIFTARNMLSFNGDLDKINRITKPIAEKWLSENNINYDNIKFGKPYCGPGGYYVDDKNLSIEEFSFKYNNVFKSKSVDIVIPFFNEAKNVLAVYNDISRLDRLFEIRKFILVDNGSTDNTLKELQSLISIDSRIEIVEIGLNIGYGYGVKCGLERSEADYCIINHSDLQFNTFNYFLENLYQIWDLKKAQSIFSRRVNRNIGDSIRTIFLRTILSVLSFRIIDEFNGQPKIIKRSIIKDKIQELPNDFTLDYVLYRIINPKEIYPVIQRSRLHGKSSWSSFSSKIGVVISYLNSAIKYASLFSK